MASHKVHISVFLLCFIFKLICSDNIEHRLMKRFYDVRSECFDSNGNKKPAFECSGLIIRGLANSAERKYAWTKSPNNIKKDAISYAYLRADQLFDRFPKDYETGFILYPHMQTPHEKNKYDVLCAFPVDGWTDSRHGRHRCGQYHDDKSGKSKPCDDQKIISIRRWILHFKDIRDSHNSFLSTRQCGFDTTTKHRTDNFAIALEANKYLREHETKYAWQNNELVIQAWNDQKPKQIPIEAFFYLIASSSGEQKAKIYQKEYAVLTGEMIPVVGIRLPQKDDPKLIVKIPTVVNTLLPKPNLPQPNKQNLVLGPLFGNRLFQPKKVVGPVIKVPLLNLLFNRRTNTINQVL